MPITHFQKICTDPTELLETTFRIIDLLNPVLGVCESSLERVFERFEPGIEFEDACSYSTLSAIYPRINVKEQRGNRPVPSGCSVGAAMTDVLNVLDDLMDN